MNKNVIAVACVTAAAATATGIVAAAGAQEAPPTVTVTMAAKSATIQGADALKSGSTRLVVKASGKGERGVIFFQLKPGVTREEMTEAAPKIQNPADARRYGTFIASAFVQGAQRYATTVNLPAAEYAVIDFSREKAVVRGAFTVGQEAGTATAPTPAATISMRDYRFSGPSTLPRNGVLQVDNDGKKLHHALVFPLRKGTRTSKVLADLKKGKEPSSKIFAGPPQALVELVSPGTKNAVEAKLQPGKNLLVCFISDGEKKPPHAALGMAKIVTVR
jgi:hypothetical protein